jgi:hypothetical protein
MTDYVRRLVSGNKARFKDKDLGLELGVFISTVYDLASVLNIPQISSM